MQSLADRHIIVGITGSIAAYKAAMLTRRLVEAGAEVQVVMSASAQRFITPMTLAALSGRAVRDSLWDEAAELSMGHIELARWAELVVIAPATADTIARLAHGRADDLLTTLCLATDAGVLVAPAMNHLMWRKPVTRANIQALRDAGIHRVGPGEGELAERESGPGRMAEPQAIRDAVVEHFAGRADDDLLAGRHVVVTAGPTREALDPVRFITNHSTGRMGYAMAAACAAAGARVTLISGPTALAAPPGVARTDVQSAADMHAAVMDVIDTADVFIGAAAVADYRPATTAADKIKKAEADKQLALTRTRDIIAEIACGYPRVFTLGFAAETDDMENAAREKLERKRLSMVAGNVVGPGRGFERDDNRLFVVWRGGEQYLARASKHALARQLIDLIGQRLAPAAA